MVKNMSEIRILIINPNSDASMTEGLRAPIESLGYNNTIYTYHNAPNPSPPSINDHATAKESAIVTLPTIIPLIPTHDAFLVACYSPHPLVKDLKALTSKPVIGILEASVSAAVALLRGNDRSGIAERFGVVSTGEGWRRILGTEIREITLTKYKAEETFCGVQTIGLNAGDLHEDGGEGEVKRKVQAATGRFFDHEEEVYWKIAVIVLGCAGMAGMEEWVREEVVNRGREVKVVDGVKAGVGILQALVRGRF